MSTIDIMGYTYEIVGDQNTVELRGGMGDNSILVQKIRVAHELHPEARVSTLLHEILHALNAHMGIGLDETQVQLLETGLWSVLRANGFDLSPLEELVDA